MNKKLLLLFISITVIFSACNNNPKGFKSNVETAKKPWTNLNFNNDPDNFQFAIMSDRNGGNRPGVFDDAVKKLNLMVPEFVLCVGDLISGYTNDTAEITKQWDEVNGIISGLKMPFFYLPGNHDITNKTMEREWEKLYGRRYYNFIYKNALFLILDSNDDDDFNLTRKQTDFVLKSLKENTDVRWTFILMHHPIWTYNTDGRFEEIENALKGRKYTVIAGHEHHYHQAERNGSNYYILSTTGAGSKLRGNYMGEFDHISWITVTDNGPVMANLRLDGILPHDISNEQTKKLAKPLLENSNFRNLILCNKREKFTNGTLYLSFKNPTDSDLKIKLNFFHHHQLKIEKPEIDILLAAGNNQVLEIPFSSSKPLDFGSIDLLCFDWEMKYNKPEYPGFALQGKYQVAVEPSKIKFIDKEINIFINKTDVGFDQPFSNLETVFSLNNSPARKYTEPISITKTSKFSFFIRNNKNEFTANENRTFEKTDYHPSTDLENPKSGLKYKYYEGEWPSMPDFSKIELKSEGVADDLLVQDLALREDNWSLVYTGFIKISNDNLCMFQVKADDACRLFINDKIVVDENTIIDGENVGSVALKKGYHPVRIEFLEKTGNQRLRLYSKENGEGDWKLIESGQFYY